MKKRILSFLLVVAMVVAMVPATMIAAFAEDSSVPTITYVGMAELDGKNTRGEYDTATKVMLNAYGNDTDGDNMRIIYTDEAIYVLVEVFDDTLVRYGTLLDDGTTKAGSSKCDFVFLGFSMGTSFQGMKRVYRDTAGGGRDVFTAPGAYVNMSDSDAALETKYFGYTEDANGFRLEARFPVSEMSERDQAYYAAGKLEIGFTAGTQDSENLGTEFALSYDGDTENRGWDGEATEDFFQSGSYEVKNPSNYPAYAFEYSIEGEVDYTPSTYYIPYVESATLDGAKTGDEYANAYETKMTYAPDAWWGKTPDANDVAYVVYTDEAIYVYVAADCGTLGTWDMTCIGFKIGESYVGSNAAQSNNPGAYIYSTGATTVDASFFAVDSAVNLEARFPIDGLTEADKAAFANGTLEIAFNFLNMDSYASTATFAVTTYKAYTENQETKVMPYLTSYTLLEKPETPEVTGPQIPLVSGATLDGAKTGNEYANALKVAMTYKADAWWGGRAPDADDAAYLVYTDDAIYVYIQGDAAGSTSWDMTSLGFKIGSSYVGAATTQGSAPSDYLFSLGESTVDASFFAVSTDGKMSLEARFPIDGLTEADKAAFEDGTLEVAFNFMNMDNYNAVTDFVIQGYADYTTQAKVEERILTKLTSYPLEKVEIEKNDMPFISDAKQDGLNTNGEYDKADTIAIDTALSGSVKLPSGYNGTSSGTAPAGSYYKVIYDDNYIYIFVNIADTTPVYYFKTEGSETDNGAYGYTDMIAVNFTIGKSFVGSNTSYRHGTNEVANTGEGTLSGYIGTPKDNGAAGWTYEARFPVNNLTDEDKAAFADGTLNVKFDVKIADNHVQGWGFSNGVVYVDGTHHFAISAKGTNYAESVVLDGKNTDREYNTATNILSSVGLWGSAPTGKEAVAKVVYTNEAIYILVEVTDDTTDAPSNDFLYLQLAVGESFRGTKVTNKETTGTTEGYTNVGGAVNLTSYQATLFKETHTDTTLTLEARLPVSLMTEADREALSAGTLSVAIATCYSNNWVIAQSHASGYGTATATKLEAIPAIELGAHDVEAGFAGANLSLGENINVNYYANLSYEDAKNAFVKFTHNNRVFIVKPVAATDKIDYYKFTYEGLGPQSLGDNIKAELCVGTPIPVDTKDDYSALQNCVNLLKTADAELKALIGDLLAYGAAAQKYVGYKTDALVNAGYEDLATEFVAPTTTDKAVGDANLVGAAFSAAGIYHANANKIYVKISVKANEDVENLSVTIDGEEAVIEATENEGIYIVYTDDINVTAFDHTFNFVLSDGANTQTLAYSVNAYATVKSEASYSKTQELAKALYNYGVSAEAYAAN